MSKYVKKQVLLEHIRREIGIISRQIDGVNKYMKKFHEGGKRSLEHIEHEVKSGAFDAEPVQEVQRSKQDMTRWWCGWNRRRRLFWTRMC